MLEIVHNFFTLTLQNKAPCHSPVLNGSSWPAFCQLFTSHHSIQYIQPWQRWAFSII